MPEPFGFATGQARSGSKQWRQGTALHMMRSGGRAREMCRVAGEDPRCREHSGFLIVGITNMNAFLTQ
jgi:hypothetical protein